MNDEMKAVLQEPNSPSCRLCGVEKDLSHKSRDLRVCKTEALLKAALVELSSARSFGSITVEHIARRAMVNRATFYRHYQDKYALAERIIEDTVDRMLEEVSAMIPPSFTFDADPTRLETPQAFVDLFEYIGRNQRLFQAILECRELPGIQLRLQGHLEERMRGKLETWRAAFKEWREIEHRSLPFDVSTAFSVAFFLSAVGWWLKSNMLYSPREMATWTRNFVFSGCKG
jgi:AcrR family transcriptional regulator